MKFASAIFILICCISCGRTQEDQVRPGDKSAFFTGRWTLKKSLYEDQVLLDVSDKAKLFRDSVAVYTRKGIPLSQNDSIRLMARINQLLLAMESNYLEFGPGEKVIASMVSYDPKAPVIYTLEGIYEVDYHKLRIELPDDIHSRPDPSGSFIWFYKNGELLLYRNYQRANESCDVYQRAE